ncbi:MAG: efflux RND transporter periplasmic adaptor subunit [Burkholderiaceae bacterium]|nr:efflux RND transporter periplasmic adaptor subunit [Burkholderiaceae bacterium]
MCAQKRSGFLLTLLMASVLAVAAVAGLSGCGAKSGEAASAPAGNAPPPPSVGVITVTPQSVGLASELPGRLEATRIAQVRARAAGILQKRLFREGSDVKAGQLLFQIDAAPYRAQLQSAQAAQARAEANREQAGAQAERYKPLLEANAISKQDYVNAVASFKQADADVASARAAVTTAQINLGYAAVVAPISGRIGRALVTEGALVGQGEATQLAVVQQIDPMYVNFTQSTTEVLRLRKAIDAGKLQRSGAAAATTVQVVLEDGSVYDAPGKLLFSDLTVDATSGQITLRAEVPNPGGLLLPGTYVRVRLQQAQASNAVLLPQQAVTRSPLGDSVLVVAPDGTFGPRSVKIGGVQAGQWVVLDGLKAGDQVMIDGFQKLRGLTVVKPVPWQPAASGAASPPPAPAASSASAAN